MKLAHLAEQIVKAAPSEMLTEQSIYASLDFVGPCNGHLAIPDWHSREHRRWDRQRFECLTGEEEINGDILVFDYVGHKGWMSLRECATLADAEKLILGSAGVFNIFTDLMLVFRNFGRHYRKFYLRPYQLTYRDDSGARVVFDRSREDSQLLLKRYRDRQIEWLPSGLGGGAARQHDD